MGSSSDEDTVVAVACHEVEEKKIRMHSFWSGIRCSCDSTTPEGIEVTGPVSVEGGIVLLALIDANYRFITVDLGAYGKNSDRSSSLGKSLVSGQLNIPSDKALPNTDFVLPRVIVGEEAFPLQRHFMRPYPGIQSAKDEAIKVYIGCSR
ncbi:hypothetical protein PR048_012190 [Dryococelus australis]|uniref:DDE Tnp4 domain-containing protein n=1 Tax=Dryococelus australis TaxID=614101 RepID=A0ABQ9HPB4_9NEOP|nr:hypothetical protein PR048_012190 [Dryococelus australis]